ncbi:MAG TPA: NAD(P)/FAD-dependent oxidoreductase [Methylomirabilota bacterium]|nr:NAD(P)/FAD-dependent oxidoreductase [Methylomirabilota bacterium]
MLTQSVDVAVVGCGVSGASSALAAAKNGVSVAIFEEHAEIGYPSHCSGHIGIESFKQYGPSLPSSLIENEIKGAILNAPSRERIILRRPTPVTWVINRAKFDQYLASLAVKNGAILNLNSRIDGIKRSDHSIKLKMRHGEVLCKMVIDAGGCGAPISRMMNTVRPDARKFVNSAQVYVEDITDIDPDFVELYYGQQFAPGFFGWIIPRKDGSAKVGLAAAARSNIRQCLGRFLKKHPVVSLKLRNAKYVTAPNFHPIPISGAMGQTYSDAFLAVGDAASQVKPTTGGGIIFGLVCGRLAGQTAVRAIQSGNTSSSFLKSYENSWRQLLGLDLKAMSLLRRLIYGMPDRHLDRVFSMAKEFRTDEVLDKASDIDFQGRILLSLARDPRLLITLLSASVLSLPSYVIGRD